MSASLTGECKTQPMSILKIPLNPTVESLYQACKLECKFDAKTDCDFLLFLLSSAVRIISLVKDFSPVLQDEKDILKKSSAPLRDQSPDMTMVEDKPPALVPTPLKSASLPPDRVSVLSNSPPPPLPSSEESHMVPDETIEEVQASEELILDVTTEESPEEHVSMSDSLTEIDVSSQLESLQKLLRSVEMSMSGTEQKPIEPIKNLNSELTEVISLNSTGEGDKTSGASAASATAPEGFRCTICSTLFESQGQLSRHIRLGTCLQTKNFFCDRCPSRFSSQKNLNRHMKRSQCGKRSLELAGCDKSTEESESKAARLDESRGATSRGVEREASPSKGTSETSDTSTPRSSVPLEPNTVLPPSEKPYKCDNCFYSFSTKAAISQHIKSMRCEDNKLKGLANDSKTAPVYQCHMCNASLASKSGLSKHLKRGQCRVYKCTLCTASFRFVHELKSHFKVQHQGSKTTMDEVIQANQIVSQALKWIGIPSMTGSSMFNSGTCYDCKICDYSATSQRSVDNHMRIHMRQIAALGADTNCFVCDFRSSDKDTLIKHYIASHPNFAVIDKTSHQASLLNIFSKLLDLAKVTTADRCVLNGNIKLGLERIFGTRTGPLEEAPGGAPLPNVTIKEEVVEMKSNGRRPNDVGRGVDEEDDEEDETVEVEVNENIDSNTSNSLTEAIRLLEQQQLSVMATEVDTS